MVRDPALLGLLGLALTSAACSTRKPPPDWPVSPPSVLCGDASLEEDDLCPPPRRLEAILREGPVRITDSALTAVGVSAPQKVRVEVTDEGGQILAFSAKWKPVPRDEGDALNNSPRRELAAYQLQKLVLSEEDWVVPPTVLRCLPLAEYGQVLIEPEPWPGTQCELGMFAYWLENVTDDNVFDEKRIERDPVYRRHLANLNVVTALMGHADSIGANMVISTDEERPRLFAIDNGLSFDAMEFNPVRLISTAWSEMRVEAIPEDTVERLKNLDGGDLQTLAVVAQMAKKGGQLVHVEHDEPFSVEEGFRTRNGQIQLGLTLEEITEAHERLLEILSELASGEIEESEPASAAAAGEPAEASSSAEAGGEAKSSTNAEERASGAR